MYSMNSKSPKLAVFLFLPFKLIKKVDREQGRIKGWGQRGRLPQAPVMKFICFK